MFQMRTGTDSSLVTGPELQLRGESLEDSVGHPVTRQLGRNEATLSWGKPPQCLRLARTVSTQHLWVARRLPFSHDNRSVYQLLALCVTMQDLTQSPSVPIRLFCIICIFR